MLSRSLISALMLAAMGVAQPALALDKIYSPNVTKGEFELEYSGSTTFDRHHDQSNIQSHEFELEYGVSDRLALELSGELEKEPGKALTSSAVGVGGHVQFFEQGEHWLDSGLLLSYGRATHRDEADTIEAKLLLEKQTGNFLHLANIGIEQAVGSHGVDGAEQVLLWNSRYRYNAHFEPGIELQSNFGRTNETLDFDQQEHYIGPAAYGQIVPGLKYEAAYLFGVSDAASQGAARVLVEYEMYF